MSKRWILSLLALALCGLTLACSSEAPKPAAPAPAPAAEPASAPAAAALPATGKVFVCPMAECNEVKAEAGKCAKCGMDLVENDRANLSWACPMAECQEVKTEPGKCSKCGMDLALRVAAAPAAAPGDAVPAPVPQN